MTDFWKQENRLYYKTVHIGECEMDVDGYYKWWPACRGGYLDSEFLSALSDFLKELNKDWDEQVVECCKLGKELDASTSNGFPFD